MIKIGKKGNQTFSSKINVSFDDKSTIEEFATHDLAPPKNKNVMENLVQAMNKIQDVFNTLKVSNTIKLPQIVMLGSQSTGKSSVLESIVHRPFLPRGTGIVTRCPLELQLIECKMDDLRHRNAKNGTTEIEEWGVFLHRENDIFTDFDKIRQEIENRTDILAGTNKGIVSDVITLKIYSPHVVTLTLVDLPGITKVKTGDQPDDIEDQIMRLVMKYIENPNSIILAVSAANTDIANSDSLKYAKMVDPEGKRTLGILTKIDLMDKGTDAWEVLDGRLIKVGLGMVGIINRSQQDILNNKTIDEQLEDEKIFFEKNYKTLAYKQGIPYLTKRLSELLKSHIFERLPDLKVEVARKLGEYKKINDLCGEEIKDRENILFRIITNVGKEFTSIVDGTALNKFMDVKNLTGGPKFRSIFDGIFVNQLNFIVPQVNKTEIISYIRNNGGPRLSIFAPENLLRDLVNVEIERLREPSQECVRNVCEEMKQVIHDLLKRDIELKRFPALEVKIRRSLLDFLNTRLPEGKIQIDELINAELSSINTNHPDFSIIEALKEHEDYTNVAVSCYFKERKVENHAATIEKLINNYFEIVKKNIQDLVPKIVIYKIINDMKENIQKELFKLHKSNLDELFFESEENIQHRSNAQTMIQALKVAKQEIESMEMEF